MVNRERQKVGIFHSFNKNVFHRIAGTKRSCGQPYFASDSLYSCAFVLKTSY